RARPRARPRTAPGRAEEAPSAPSAEVLDQPLDGLPLSVPEPALAARVPPPSSAPPLPSGRRAIFFDVENTSRAEHIARVLAHLAVDRAGRRTEFFAVGNWRVIGHDTARLLARHGAALVHSAPSVGVRDWSDLRIAVASGVWLAGARAGGGEPHTAPHDEIVAVVRDLARSRGTVTLDSLANALKSRGFSRPPGSPRLITRLRRIKELEVNRAGVITLVGDEAAAPVTETPEREESSERV